MTQTYQAPSKANSNGLNADHYTNKILTCIAEFYSTVNPEDANSIIGAALAEYVSQRHIDPEFRREIANTTNAITNFLYKVEKNFSCYEEKLKKEASNG